MNLEELSEHLFRQSLRDLDIQHEARGSEAEESDIAKRQINLAIRESPQVNKDYPPTLLLNCPSLTKNTVALKSPVGGVP